MSIKYSRGKNRLRSPLNSETPSNLKPLRYAMTNRVAPSSSSRVVSSVSAKMSGPATTTNDDEDQERPKQRVLLRPAAFEAALERLQRCDDRPEEATHRVRSCRGPNDNSCRRRSRARPGLEVPGRYAVPLTLMTMIAIRQMKLTICTEKKAKRTETIASVCTKQT